MSLHNEVSRIKNDVSLEEVAKAYQVVFDKRNRGKCPFPTNHVNGDADPSLFLDRELGRIYCNSSRCFDQGDIKGADVISFVQKMENCGFGKAVEIVTSRFIVRCDGDNGRQDEPKSEDYDYQGRDGTTVYTICRREEDGKKSFYCRPAGVSQEDRVLYRLPELLDGDDPVVIVEGEKCVDALVELGVTATCNPFGAGKWEHRYGALLNDRDVVVWPDNDDPGRRHAADVAGSLRGVVRKLRMVEPTSWLPDKGDVVDVLLDGRGGPKLALSMITDAPLHEASSPPEGKSSVVCLADVLPEETEWLWEPRIPLRHLTLLFGDGGVGKTHICLAIAAAITRGDKMPDSETQVGPANVLIFTGEDRLPEIRRRMDQLGANPAHVFADATPFALKSSLDFIEEEIRKHSVVAAFLDPMVAFLSGGIDLHRANDLRSVLAPLNAIADRTNAAIVLSTHINKGGSSKATHRALGSVDFTNASRSALFAAADGEQRGAARALFHVKANLGRTAEPLGYEIGDGGFGWLDACTISLEQALGLGSVTTGGPTMNQADFFLLAELADQEWHEASKVLALCAERGLSRRTVQRAASQLCDHTGGGFGGQKMWRLRDEIEP